MYEAFFGLSRRPFPAVPSVAHYFAAEAIQQSRHALARTIERAEGVGLIIGPAGIGKTLLCQVLADQFRSQFAVVNLSSAQLCTRRALLQNILFEMRLPFREMEEGELRLSLIDHLEPSDRCPRGMLLIIDEAHTLPLRLLEEVRLITNLVRHGEPRVRLVLAGNAKLEERLASPRLESFNQRVATRCYLHSLNQYETRQYVQQQIRLAGGDADKIFDDDAYPALFQATDGVPRLVNQVSDHVLILAYAGGHHRIGARAIEEAWADLQRLPAPWVASDVHGSDSVIEFGRLDDDDELDESLADQSDAIERALSISSTRELNPQPETNSASVTFESHALEPAAFGGVESVEWAADDDVNLASAWETPVERDGNEHWPADGATAEIQQADTVEVSHSASAQVSGNMSPGDASQPAAVDLVELFGGPFADEDIVFDQFRSWDRETSSKLPRVTSVESREMAAALATIKPTAAKTAVTASTGSLRGGRSGMEPERGVARAVEEIQQLTQQALLPEALLHQVDTLGTGCARAADTADHRAPEASDVLLSDVNGTQLNFWGPPHATQFSRHPAIAHSAAHHAEEMADDRDMLVFDDEQPELIKLPAATPRVQRQEYRRLFGQLRRG